MAGAEQVVARFRDGRMLKGYANKFSIDADIVDINEEGTGKTHRIPIVDLKALFFTKSLDGDSEYRERKAFGIREHKGHKVYIKFNDRESLVGYIEGDVPWSKGFFVSDQEHKAKGFFMQPADHGSNNERVFVVASSVDDVTVMTK